VNQFKTDVVAKNARGYKCRSRIGSAVDARPPFLLSSIKERREIVAPKKRPNLAIGQRNLFFQIISPKANVFLNFDLIIIFKKME